jgi:hypothetical protein
LPHDEQPRSGIEHGRNAFMPDGDCYGHGPGRGSWRASKDRPDSLPSAPGNDPC